MWRIRRKPIQDAQDVVLAGLAVGIITASVPIDTTGRADTLLLGAVQRRPLHRAAHVLGFIVAIGRWRTHHQPKALPS